MEKENNYFQLFNLKTDFRVNLKTLKMSYRELQKVVHPDNYVNATDSERRLAMQQTTRINDAFHTLSDPVKRAHHLLSSCYDMQFEQESTHQDTAFLMEQMELREALDRAKKASDPLQQLTVLHDNIKQRLRDIESAMVLLFDEHSSESLQSAADSAEKLQFLQKLQAECQAREDELLGLF